MSTPGFMRSYIPDKTAFIAAKRKASNTLLALVSTGVIGLGFAGYLYYSNFYAAGWHNNSKGTYYIFKDTKERATGYQIIDNTCYLFDDDGQIMTPGWHDFRGDTYYLGNDGIIQRGRITIDGEEYYLSSESGVFRTGLVKINGEEYYFDDHGFPGSGIEGGNYFSESGKKYKGWVNIGGSQYYFKNDGEMAIGFYEIESENEDGKMNVYYFDNDGKMATSWQVIRGTKYLFGDNGVLHKGWIAQDGKYYYADDETGACIQGFTEIDGKTYYFDEYAQMVRGWSKIKGKRYHFSDKGEMTSGWYVEDPHKYYLQPTGEAAQGFTEIDGSLYYFDDNNKLLDGWQTIDGTRYYLGYGGVAASGWTTIGNDTFYFYPEDHIAAYGWVSIDQKNDKDTERFISDMEALDTNGRSSGLNADEFTALSNKYAAGTLDGYQRQAYEELGSEVMSNHYFYNDNALAYGWLRVKGYLFHFDEETGEKTTGWADIDGDRYYFGETGAAAEGVFGSYLFSSNGKLSDGLVKLDGHIKYRSGSDWIRNRFFTEGNRTYYFDGSGNALTGRQIIDGNEYFFSNDGVMTKGLYPDGANTYYISEDGIVTSKWVTVSNGDRYYFGADGKASTGWTTVSGTEFYFSDNGVLQDGWTTIGGNRYYLENGVALRGPILTDSGFYNLGESGYVTEGWLTWSGYTYYNLAGGRVCTGWTTIDGKRYYFDSEGRMEYNIVIDDIELGPDGAAVE